MSVYVRSVFLFRRAYCLFICVWNHPFARSLGVCVRKCVHVRMRVRVCLRLQLHMCVRVRIRVRVRVCVQCVC